MATPVIDPISNFVRLERVLAAILVLTPLLLLLVDDAAGVNGVLKDGHWYNWIVGVLLSLLIVFDHDGASKYLHFLGAIGFFVGNVAVMLWFSKDKPRRLVVGLVGTIAVAIALWMVTDWFTLFWAEWVSLAIIAAHYLLDTIPVRYVRYTALTKHDAAQLSAPRLLEPSIGAEDELQPAIG
jgi:hypothetical protein